MHDMRELKQQFAQADPRFGPVPFWWWSAEPVTEERIRWQMQKFRQGGLRNIGIINLAPTGPQYGSIGDQPAYGSEAWWELFGFTVREAEKLGMFVWFYDQIGFSGANLIARIVAEQPAYAGYHLRRFAGNQELPKDAERLYEDGEAIYAAVRQGFNWLDPAAAGELLRRVHGEMERRFGPQLGRVIAGSFQDELPPLPLWTPALDGKYRERFGEALAPLLPALFDPLPGAETVRRRVYRLAAELAEESWFIPLGDWHRRHGMLIGCDQAGPARRGDPNGAQRLYLDYFRTHRWYNAPGTDMDGEIKPHASMVHLHGESGSRVWLEGFHSSGWGGTLEETMHWLIPWLQAGATLYSPHSIYYSTRGGWWEWAPPDTGWRQPYFEHYPIFADTVSRVCALLSEGVHVCEVAVHYPAYAVCGHFSLNDGGELEHPMAVANRDPNESVTRLQRVYREVAGSWNRRDHARPGALRKARIDFDIADDAALAKSVPDGGRLQIADEAFSALLLCGTTLMDAEARRRVEDWIGQGGLVVGVEIPADERNWPGIVYAASTEEAVALIAPQLPHSVKGAGATLQRRTPEADIFLLLPRDGEGGLLAMHEPARPELAAPAQTLYRLKTVREPELWDPVSGTTQPLPYRRDGEWIEITAPFDTWPAALVVCSDHGPALPAGGKAGSAAKLTADDLGVSGTDVYGAAGGLPLSGDNDKGQRPVAQHHFLDNSAAGPGTALPVNDWRIKAIPTLDNRYGDFDLHDQTGDSGGLMPIERRSLRVRTEGDEEPADKWHTAEYDDGDWQERLWSEAAYFHLCRGDRFDDSQAQPAVFSLAFGDLSVRPWAGRMGRVPRRFLNFGRVGRGESAWAKTYCVAPEAGDYWIRLESNAEITGEVGGRPIDWSGGPEEQTARIRLAKGPNELLLQARPAGKGPLRAAVEVNALPRPPLPKWLFVREPLPNARLSRTLVTGPEQPVRRVRLVFAARGRAALVVNGVKLTEHGDYNPYIRQGQEEVDVTSCWRIGENEVTIVLPEGKGEVFIDGLVELTGGETISFCTGSDWTDEAGGEPGILHSSVLQYAETESLWLSPRPHPLPEVGWLMPEHEAQHAPLPFVADPAKLGRPVWLRFPVPVGAFKLRLACEGEARIWVNGAEASMRGGVAEFPVQRAGAIAAIRIEPTAWRTEAAVLRAPIRFETTAAPGDLGDWRTALELPHHSGIVEYRTKISLRKDLTRAVLDLGHVRGTAEAWLDGEPLGVRLWKPYRYELPGQVTEGEHELTVRVANTLGAHYEVGRPTSLVGGSPDMTYWSTERPQEQAWQPWFASGGLYGPVTLQEASCLTDMKVKLGAAVPEA
ncbi:hypothetical protein [Paenibacillus puerhi]|uniref:hypothetical protein n=1 Tax=Paenibacillus puerhi TaxID=2692622 RepID=UPI001F3396EB|nr:hypothetical protein [Paenibacillus puerhi]